jgi:hypothetical protein
MTITCSVDHKRHYMEATASGSVAWEEVRTHLLDERREHGLTYAELIDARSATPTWSSAQAREIVGLLKTLGLESSLGPTAIVVAHDYAYGMLRMLEILLDDVCLVRPFRDYREAEQWLWSLPVSLRTGPE